MRGISVPIDNLHLKVTVTNPVRKKTSADTLAIGNCKNQFFRTYGKSRYRFRTDYSTPRGGPMLSQFVNANFPGPAAARYWGAQNIPFAELTLQLSLAFSQIFARPDYKQLEPLRKCYWYLYWMDVWHISADAVFIASNGKRLKGTIEIPQAVELKLLARPDCCDGEKKIWHKTGHGADWDDKDNAILKKLSKGAKNHVEPERDLGLDDDFIPGVDPDPIFSRSQSASGSVTAATAGDGKSGRKKKSKPSKTNAKGDAKSREKAAKQKQAKDKKPKKDGGKPKGKKKKKG